MMHIRGGYGKKVAAQAAYMERLRPILQPTRNYNAGFPGQFYPAADCGRTKGILAEGVAPTLSAQPNTWFSR